MRGLILPRSRDNLVHSVGPWEGFTQRDGVIKLAFNPQQLGQIERVNIYICLQNLFFGTWTCLCCVFIYLHPYWPMTECKDLI